MGLHLIRENSDTPNVTNKDDARMARYAYGGQNGYVKGYGTELKSAVNGNIFGIGSGIVVLQGWETKIDSNGWSMTVSTSDATTKYYTVYLEVNLSLDAVAEIKSVSDTAGYPTIDEGDDLTANPNGVARLALYRFTATRGNISNVTKLIEECSYQMDEITKINRRLDAMGFKKATYQEGEILIPETWEVAGQGTTPIKSPQVEVERMGNAIVIKRIVLSHVLNGNEIEQAESGELIIFLNYELLGSLPTEFYVANNVNAKISVYCYVYQTNRTIIQKRLTGDISILGSLIILNVDALAGNIVYDSDHPIIVEGENIGWITAEP